ncbi:MAG: MBL fold metallo-hydrolase [Gammaproteobacteria bacterium]|nr:MAG: MBL fold metallo-hydrolase [Gammaproteobacteria bacterium]
MKRLLTLITVTPLVLFMTFAALAEFDYPPATVKMELIKVSEHVYYVQGIPGVATDNQGFISNAGVIVTGEGIVVFDALGTPSLGNLLLKKIRAISDQPIVRVITSHYHADHIYGLQVFEEQGAKIWAPSGAEDYLASENAQERLEERRFSLEPWVNETSRLVAPDHYLTEQESFKLGSVRFTLTPVGAAHSDGDLTLYVEPDRVLFSGDIIFEGRVPFLGDANSRHWLEVLKRMESQQLAALVPGHGAAAADPDRAVSQTRRYLSYLREKMGESAADLVPFDEAYQAVDWSGFADLPAFAEANRRNAYQVYLSMEAESLSE